MKTITLIALLAAAAAAQAEPATSTLKDIKQEIRGRLFFPQLGSDVKMSRAFELNSDGKGTASITLEKDGKKVTRTLTFAQNNTQLFDLDTQLFDDNAHLQNVIDQMVAELTGGGGTTADKPPKKTVTYLGVMLQESGAGGLGGGFLGDGAGMAPGGGPVADASPKAPGLPPGTGLRVTGVGPGSPAEKAGLQGGDTLAKLNDQILVNPSQFTTLIRNMKPGDTVKVTFVRNGEFKEVETTLAGRDEEPTAARNFDWTTPELKIDRIDRVLSIDPHGNVVEVKPGGTAPPAPPAPPQPPLSPDAPAAPSAPLPPDAQSFRPAWEKAMREAAQAKESATAQWQEQLSKWRAEWAEGQKHAAEEYRKAMEKMGEELAKAREAAVKAREEARHALEEVRRKIEEERAKSLPKPETKPDQGDSDQPKNT